MSGVQTELAVLRQKVMLSASKRAAEYRHECELGMHKAVEGEAQAVNDLQRAASKCKAAAGRTGAAHKALKTATAASRNAYDAALHDSPGIVSEAVAGVQHSGPFKVPYDIYGRDDVSTELG